MKFGPHVTEVRGGISVGEKRVKTVPRFPWSQCVCRLCGEAGTLGLTQSGAHWAGSRTLCFCATGSSAPQCCTWGKTAHVGEFKKSPSIPPLELSHRFCPSVREMPSISPKIAAFIPHKLHSVSLIRQTYCAQYSVHPNWFILKNHLFFLGHNLVQMIHPDEIRSHSYPHPIILLFILFTHTLLIFF